jgi:alkylhydroperoxidase family enzyme
MIAFPIHTIASAPEASKALLATLEKTFGFLPNIAAAMAESPVLLGAFVPLFGAVHGGTFTEAQIQVVLLTNAVTNRSEWPVALHTLLATKAGIPPTDVAALREGRPPADPKVAALSALARNLIEARGHVDTAVVDAFVAAGHRRDQVLELITISAASTITNYAAGLTRPPVDPQIAAYAWKADAR